ncbi:MAG: type 4a pilus biogenesis protein PilO [bacterium]
MKKLTEKQKLYLIIFLIIGGGGFVFYNNFFKPLNNEIKSLSSQKKDKETTLSANRKEAARLPFVEEESRRLKIELSYAEQVLPKDLDVPYLLTTLTRLSEEYKVYFPAFSPGTIEEKGDYAVYPINLSITGTFHNVIKFICAIGNLERLINTIDLSVGASGGGQTTEEKKGPVDTVSVPLKLESYIYR